MNFSNDLVPYKPPTCTRRLEFDAGHRVMNHESKCATLHGHRYVVEVTAEAFALDSIGRVIDFSVLKEKVGGWIDEKWDHTTLVCEEDLLVASALVGLPSYKGPFICPFNPTAENMAEYLLHHVCPLVLADTGVRVTRVRLYETPNCYAEAVL